MHANELPLNQASDAYDLASEFRARRDERAYALLNNAVAYVIIAHAARTVSNRSRPRCAIGCYDRAAEH